MKKLFLVAGVFVLLLALILPVRGTEFDMEAEYNDEMRSFLDSLPPELQERYQDIINGSGGFEKVLDETDGASVLAEVESALKNAFPSAVTLFIRLTGMILCAGLFGRCADGFDGEAVSGGFRLCTTLCFSLALMKNVSALLTNSSQFLETIAGIATGSVPIVSVVTAATGNITAAAVSRTSLMLVFAVIQNLCAVCIVPVVRLSFVLGIASGVNGVVRLEGVSRCVRRLLMIVLSFAVTLCGFVIGVQTILAKSADTFSLRTVKFALGNAVPLVGTALAEAMTTVTGSLSLIRSAAGGLAVFAVLVLLLPVLIQLILHRLVLAVCQGIAEMAGCEKEASLLGGIHETLGFLLAVVALSAALLIFVLALFALVGGSA